MAHRRSRILFAALSLLAACGGGGGRGGFSVAPSSLTFRADRGGALPPGKSLRITVTDDRAAHLVSDWRDGEPTWLTVGDLDVVSNGAADVLVWVGTTDLPAGTYESTLRIGLVDEDDTLLSSSDVKFTYELREALSASPSTLEFRCGVGGPVPAAATIDVGGEGLGWESSADRTWIQAAGSGTGPATLTVGVDPSGLAAGTYDGTVTIAGTGDASDRRATVGVHLVVDALELVAGPTSLTFSGIHGASIPTQPLALSTDTGAAVAWTATPGADWITLSKSTGRTADAVDVGVDTRSLPATAGAYSSSITFSATYAGATVTKVVPVSLAVAASTLDTDVTSLSFSGVNGADLPTRAVAPSVSNGRAAVWTATPGAPWITVARSSGTCPDSVVVGVDPSQGPLASGQYSSSITLSATYDGATLTKVIPVDLRLTRATLSVSPTELSAGGPLGRPVPQPAEIVLSLDTGARAHRWTATQDHPWIGLDALSGTVGPPTTIHATWDRTGLTGGTYTGAIQITAAVNGDSLTARIPVTLNLDAHRILAQDDGVAFSSMPGLQALTRTIPLRDNTDAYAATPWTATTDQPWLRATASGTTPGDLVLTADPAGLAADRLYTGTVTIQSSDATVAGPERIRVGLWVGATAPAATVTIPTWYLYVVTDPIRPYAYVHSLESDLTVYNVFTGAVVTTISTNVAHLGQMAIASDGSRLYAVDYIRRAIVPVDLADFSVGSAFPVGTPLSSIDPLACTRTNGKQLLHTGPGEVLDAATGARMGSGRPGSDLMAASRDGNWLAAGSRGMGPSTFRPFWVEYTAVGGGQAYVSDTGWFESDSWGMDLALDATGTRIYYAARDPYGLTVYEVTTYPVWTWTLPGAAYATNVEVARDGRIVAGSSDSGPEDTWIYAPTGERLGAMKLSGSGTLSAGELKLSGDDLRLVALTSDPALKFVTLPR